MNAKEKPKIISFAPAVLVMAILALCALVLLQRGSLSSVIMAQSESVLGLTISTPKATYLTKEPIELTFDLVNQTSQPIAWSSLVDFGGMTNLRIRMPNGELRVWKGERGMDYPTGGRENTMPGKHKVVTRLIDDSIMPNVFVQSGHYEIRVEFSYLDISSGEPRTKTILSNSIGFEIRNPLGRDRAALEYIENVIDPVRRRNILAEEVVSLRFFTDSFRDSVYWKYMSFSLAKKYLELGRNQDAEDVLYELSDKDFCFSKDVDRLLNRLAITLHRPTPRTKRLSIDPDPPIFRVIPGPHATPVRIPPIPRPVVVVQSTPSIQ